jgi:hypothetical protein
MDEHRQESMVQTINTGSSDGRVLVPESLHAGRFSRHANVFSPLLNFSFYMNKPSIVAAILRMQGNKNNDSIRQVSVCGRGIPPSLDGRLEDRFSKAPDSNPVSSSESSS